MTDTADEFLTGVVPLPAHLERCGCPHATNGRHLVSCIPAREHDAIPLSERPEYKEGQRFRAISWVYPLTIEATMRVTVELDPVPFINAHRAQYEAFELDAAEYEEWEKPIVFISYLIEEECDPGYFGFGVGRHVATVSANMDDIHNHPRWGRDDCTAVVERLGPIVNPDQGSLLE